MLPVGLPNPCATFGTTCDVKGRTALSSQSGGVGILIIGFGRSTKIGARYLRPDTQTGHPRRGDFRRDREVRAEHARTEALMSGPISRVVANCWRQVSMPRLRTSGCDTLTNSPDCRSGL